MIILPTLRSLSYEERQHHLNLISLSYPQFKGDMLTTFQVQNNVVDLDATVFLISQPLHISGATHINFLQGTQELMSERNILQIKLSRNGTPI